jgi:prepilin-type N-terminal cleavage/methylation domain-containing protein
MMNTKDPPCRAGARRAAFTLIEIMIVVMIIGILSSIAVPSIRGHIQSAQYRAIVANLRIIELAKAQWAAESRKGDDAIPTEEDLAPTFQGGRFPPAVVGEIYNINPLKERPTATVPSKVYKVEAGGTVKLDDVPSK